MRLRKNFKRTAAAALALSMAVSAATPAMASYTIDIRKDDYVEIVKDSKGVSVKLNGKEVTKDQADDSDDIIIKGDYSQARSNPSGQSMDDAPDAENKAATLEAPEKDAAPVVDENELTYGDTEDIDNTEDTDNTEEDSEDTPTPTDGIATMDLPGEDEPEGTADEGQPERTVTETELGTVIEYGDYTVDPDVQVSQTTPKAEKKDDEKEYTNSSAASTFAEGAARAAATVRDYVIKIINNVKGEDNSLNVTLDNVSIDVSSTTVKKNTAKGAMGVEGAGDVTIKLKGNNTLKSGETYAGLEKDVETTGEGENLKVADGYGTLTITSDEKAGDGSYDGYEGKLTATGGDYGAGIGGGSNYDGSKKYEGLSTGNITIAGGSISALKNQSQTGAGIGGGAGATGGNAANIIINDGNITATAGQRSAGIGGGSSNGNFSSGGDAVITINGGVINATGNIQGAGIGGGGGYSRNGGDASISINGGEITATSGQGAGIGSGSGSGTNYTGGIAWVTIKNATIKAATGNTGIGSGYSGSKKRTEPSGHIKIIDSIIGDFDEDGNLKENTGAIGQAGGAGIGGGLYETADITISGNSKVAATGKSGSIAIGNGGTKQQYTVVPADEKDTFTHDEDLEIIKPTDTSGNNWDVTIVQKKAAPTPGDDSGNTDPNPGDNTNTTPSDDSNSSDSTAALELRVLDADKLDMPFAVSQSGAVRTYTADADVATLTGSMETLAYLKENGASTITFVTNQQTTSFAIDDLLAQSSSATFYLTHTGAEEAQMLVVE